MIACGSHSHSRGELADVVFIKQAVDTAIFLVKSYQQRMRMTRMVGYGLQLLNEKCRLVSGWDVTVELVIDYTWIWDFLYPC